MGGVVSLDCAIPFYSYLRHEEWGLLMARNSLRAPREINYSKFFLTNPRCMTVSEPLGPKVVGNCPGQLWDFWIINRCHSSGSESLDGQEAFKCLFLFCFGSWHTCKLRSSSPSIQRWKKQPQTRKLVHCPLLEICR